MGDSDPGAPSVRPVHESNVYHVSHRTEFDFLSQKATPKTHSTSTRQGFHENPRILFFIEKVTYLGCSGRVVIIF